MKNQLTKETLKWLKAQAAQLPPDNTVTFEIREVQGSEMLLSGLRVTSDTKEAIIPHGIYRIKVPSIMPMNHERLLRKAFKRAGWMGANKYLDKYRVPGEKLFAKPVLIAQPEKPKTIIERIVNLVTK